MAKSLKEHILEMETRCNQLEELQKLFEKAVKSQFGMDAKQIKKLIENEHSNTSEFSRKIRGYFGLNSEKDYEDFITVFCSESSLNYFRSKRNN